MTPKAPITVVFCTKNEEVNLPYALDAVRDWAEKVYVVDCGSTDRTKEVAQAAGAEYVFQEWLGFSRQKNWALDTLPMTTPWVLSLDADEIIQPDLRDEMIRIATEDKCPENAFYMNRFFIFLEKRLWHCGYYPSWNVRFFRRGKARWEDRDVHEHMIVDGAVGYLRGEMEHNDRRGLEYYILKHNQYSTLEAREMAKILLGRNGHIASPPWREPPERRRWIKRHVWPRLPLRWVARFLYMYVFRLGFLDGIMGFNFCLFMASYEHQVGLKLKEIVLAERQKATQAPAPQGQGG